VLAVAGGVMLAGCAAGRGRADGGAVVVRDKGYRVTVPAGWEPLPSVEADVALRQAALGAGLMAHGTCEGKTPRRSLPVLVRHLRFGLRDVQELSESPVTVGGLPGTAQRFRATLDGVPVAVRAVTLRGAGCVYDLVGVAPPESLAALTPDFERFAGGFTVTGSPR
jgi:hypothetical protein